MQCARLLLRYGCTRNDGFSFLTRFCLLFRRPVLQSRLAGSHVPAGAEQHTILSAQLTDIRFWDVQSGFGYVFTARFRATPKSTPLQVVLKVPKHSEKEWDAKAFGEELNVMAAVIHPNVVRFIGVWPRPDQDPIAATGAAYAVVTEYVPSGTLSQRVGGSGAFQLLAVTRVDVLWQLASAVAHLHGAGVVHRDLKPDNVLLAAQNEVKLCDFGLSRFGRSSSAALNGAVVSASGAEAVHLAATQAFGTPHYAAPEQFDVKLSAALSSAVDVYAFGVVMYFLLTAQAPWSQELKQHAEAEAKAEKQATASAKAMQNQSALISQWVLAGRRPALSAALRRDNLQYVQLMEWCWQQTPSARPSMSQVQSELQSLHALLTAPSAVLPLASQTLPMAGAGSFPSLSLAAGPSSSKNPSTFVGGLGAGFVEVEGGLSTGTGKPSSSALKPLAASGTLGLAPARIPSHFPLFTAASAGPHTKAPAVVSAVPDPNNPANAASLASTVLPSFSGGRLVPASIGTASNTLASK
jgi:serine/threonine protein kinase